MKDKTKKVLLAIGGIGVGLVAVSTGGALLGTAVAGILVRTGALKVSPQVSQEGVRLVTSAGNIISSLLTGTACVVSGVKMNMDATGDLVDALDEREEVRIKISQDLKAPNFVIIEAR